MERRLKAAAKVYRGGDADAVKKCAEYLYHAFRVTPESARQQEANIRGFRSLIDRSGIDPDGIPRAVALALSRYFGTDVDPCERAVAFNGADTILATMALPPDRRAAFLTSGQASA